MPYDSALAKRLTEERKRFGNNRAFYKSTPWRALRADVLREAHGECQDCKAKSPAKYTPATCVHHEMHVDTHPGWALSRTYTGEDGTDHDNLIPLCHECHDIAHGRFRGRGRDSSHDVTAERW